MIPQFEEICREAMRIDELGDDIDGEDVYNISELTIDVCCNHDVVAIIRKALPEIQRHMVRSATDEEDRRHSIQLEDTIGMVISNFLIAAARIQHAARETRCDDDARSPRRSRKKGSQKLNISQQSTHTAAA
jgi:hypothetical protein